MKMKITGNGARNLNKAALNSGRATNRRPVTSNNAETTRRQLNSNHKETRRRQLNSNYKATRRPAVNAASRRPLAPVATERPMLNSSARRPVSRLTHTKADLKSSRRPVRPLATDDKNYKLNSARRPLRRLNSNRDSIIKELEGWFDKDEAVEYLNSFEKSTGATATKLATDEEVDKYDGVFWATKDGKESLWCLHNGKWIEEDLDSAKKLNSAEGEATEEVESEKGPVSEEAPATEESAENEATEEEIEVTDLLIVQDPESKELSLFIPDTPEEAVPEDVEVIATVEPATVEDLDSSCGGKKKLNSSEESESTEEEAVVELPDGETVEVEDIFVVQTDDGEYDLFIAEEDAELPEEVEVVGEAVAVEEEDILNSSRQLKKLNSSKKAATKKVSK